jgi:hypothetical protein
VRELGLNNKEGCVPGFQIGTSGDEIPSSEVEQRTSFDSRHSLMTRYSIVKRTGERDEIRSQMILEYS